LILCNYFQKKLTSFGLLPIFWINV
jgi:hypothetical protein